MKREKEIKKIVDKAKEFVAESAGFKSDVLETKWFLAMEITHRTRNQVQLYENLAFLLAELYLKRTKQLAHSKLK